MRGSFLGLVIGMISLLLLSSSGRSLWAIQVRGGEQLVISQDQVINESLLISGGRVRIDGKVDGDVVCAGGNISIDGTVVGSLTVAGGQVDLKGSIHRTLWVAGGDIRIDGSVQGDALVVGGNVEIGRNGTIGRDLAAWSGNVELAGTVGGTVKGGIGNLDLSGRVGRDVSTRVQKLTVRSTSIIGGDLRYEAAQAATIEEGATINGQVIRQPLKERSRPDHAPWTLIFFVIELVFLAAAVLFGALFILWTPRQASTIASKISTSPWASLGIGFVFLVVTPVAVALLFFTLVGFPIAMALVFLYCFLLYLSKIFTGLLLGRHILSKWSGQGKGWLIGSMALGVTIIFLASGIPFIGWLIYLVAVLLGLGAIVIAHKELWEKCRQKGIL